MQIRVIGSERDVTGFGLAGVHGIACRTRAEVAASLAQWAHDPAIAIVLVSHDAAALAADDIQRFRATVDVPIVVVLPPAEAEPAAGRPAA